MSVTIDPPAPTLKPIRRLLAAGTLILGQILALDAVYDVRSLGAAAGWLWVNDLVKQALYTAVYGAFAAAILIWPRRAALAQALAETPPTRRPALWLGLNLASFAAALTLIVAARMSAPEGSLLWLTLGAAAALALAMIGGAAAWALSAQATAAAWRAARSSLLIAALFAPLLTALTIGARESWTSWSDLTFSVSAGLLTGLGFEPHVDAAAKVLGVRGFLVHIAPHCSGYEGVGLVTGFLALYIAAYRRSLRFPHVLALLPLAAAAVWALNAVRIVALVLIGGYVSPAIAVGGFHSQAGWALFVLTAMGAIALAHGLRFFNRARPPALAARDEPLGPAGPYLAPLAALLTAGLLSQLFSSENNYLGAPLALAFGGFALWAMRRRYRPIAWRPTPAALIVGVLIGAFWAATDPAFANPAPHWLSTAPAGLVALYLAIRVLGFCVITPIAEELAFRGYVQRAVMGKDFETVPIGALAPIAVLVACAGFAVLHERWLSAGLAGLAYALLASRGARLTDAVAAHAASNATIAAIAIAVQNWALI